MLGVSARQGVLLAIVLVGGWVLIAPSTKTALLWDLKTHFGLVLLFAAQTCFVAWLIQWRRRSALYPMLIAAFFLSRWAAEGLPCVLPLRSGDLDYAAVLTPLAALRGVRFWQAFPAVKMFSGQQG